MSKTTFRFIDLFAGLGGFHIALKRLGGECVFAAEWQEHLQDLYEVNHGIRPAGDITAITKGHLAEVPEHDVLTAGFPCQPFSKAGEQLGFECTKQGGLFFDVEKILAARKPSFFILENVPNLLKHDEGETWKKIQKMLGLDGLGYHIDAQKYSPHNFGVPQIRERVYIVGSLKPLDSFVWPERSNEETSIETVLDENPPDAKRLSKQVQECLDVWSEFLQACPKGLNLPSFPLWSMEWGATYPYETETPFARKLRLGAEGLLGFCGSHGVKLGHKATLEERWNALPSHARTEQFVFPKWKQNFIRQNREFYAANREWITPWRQKILRFPSSLQKFEWNIQGGHQDLWQYVIQFRASGVRVKRRNTAPSLIAMTDTQVPIIAWEKRYMTPLECARLQSMESLKRLPDKPSQAFAALGNAVNADVVEKVAAALLKSLPGFAKAASTARQLAAA
ncbi:DNA (cytosine-5-)-methyltransferase [Thauera linaloolentis]|uniref:Cytosine-specific methyltransferase n=1 Tax=Thauera linaloolentis (strain DSM 12138 / JCM 21573 / CCUG 41526 / CIP 105981 / IAM 15112 / NBRC 102519 / 47Lol) TaxID=1123367 RepID=N6XR49_THAL4|nr:DNA (cytosine-5-)-methyltransferase [Thauera linaloolentis]ENO84196.1 cytosine-specific DNA-methyltransferase [Thauera linaloolentis 47Lol = DSM 12138]MCM8567705.1 DNA (cytosine-5-)-methyltransferase [Thauera linaloolentis]